MTLVNRLPDGRCEAVDLEGKTPDHGDCSYLVFTDMATPIELGRMALPSYLRDIDVVGDHAYIASSRTGLHVVDVSSPAAPVELGSVPTGDFTVGVVVNDNHAYVAAWYDGLRIVDISTPAAPESALHCYPNPFNPQTAVSFTLQLAGPARLAIYDVRGKEIVVLADDVYGAGDHELNWDGRDSSGHAVASGAYFCQLRAGKNRTTMQMVLVR